MCHPDCPKCSGNPILTALCPWGGTPTSLPLDPRHRPLPLLQDPRQYPFRPLPDPIAALSVHPWTPATILSSALLLTPVL